MSKKENKLAIFKSPGVYTKELDINLFYGDEFRCYCGECYKLQYNTFDDIQYCLECAKMTPIINKKKLRELKIDKLI